jgi:F-type H+-transporting ATPase subunit epsilon
MAATIEFELVSPERLLKSVPVEMVVVPCVEGDIGVLPGHSPLIATVRPGVIDIHEQGRVIESIFVADGFAEVSPKRCTVLAEEAVLVTDLERGAVERRLNRAKEALSDAETPAQKKTAERAVRVAEAMLRAIEPRRVA